MTNETNENGELLPDGARLIPYGCFLRKTSLDELPELINIIKGDMAIVGPRPLLSKYLPYYTDREKLRHSVLKTVIKVIKRDDIVDAGSYEMLDLDQEREHTSAHYQDT